MFWSLYTICPRVRPWFARSAAAGRIGWLHPSSLPPPTSAENTEGIAPSIRIPHPRSSMRHSASSPHAIALASLVNTCYLPLAESIVLHLRSPVFAAPGVANPIKANQARSNQIRPKHFCRPFKTVNFVSRQPHFWTFGLQSIPSESLRPASLPLCGEPVKHPWL